MASYKPTIGLEIHAELSTKTKMFCDCRNDPDEDRPNVHVCPICMAHPGTLPVINREAVRHILRMGSAVGGELAVFSEFDRKSYFYPDIPKGYQISQYAHPFVKGGSLAGVAITRIHLEEDTARSVHGAGKTLVDFNRAGVPLMELVTEPVIPDAETAGRFARELQLLLRSLGAGNANLEKGEMRVEVNVSVSAEGAPSKNYVEVKNINSFRAVERAIAYEIKRQTAVLEAGERVVKATRGWDESKQATFHQRFKEGSADYRYFPEPDLPKLYPHEIAEFAPEAVAASLPELPWERRARYLAAGISPEHAEVFLYDERLGTLFEETRALQPRASVLIANYIGSDIAGLRAKHGDAGLAHISAHGLSVALAMYSAGTLSSRGLKDAIADAYTSGGDLAEGAKKYVQESDAAALHAVVAAVVTAEKKAVEEYQAGKEPALQYLVGKAMKESKGAGNPQILRALFIEKLQQSS